MTTFNIGFVIFPNLTQLDFTGPMEVLHRLPETEIDPKRERGDELRQANLRAIRIRSHAGAALRDGARAVKGSR